MASVMAFVGSPCAVTASHALIGATTCLAILGFELPQRVAGMTSGSVSIRTYAKGVAVIACRCAPEVLGMLLCMLAALMLRIRGAVDDVWQPQLDPALWTQVTATEWPLLYGADTLLCLQTWLRLIAVMFVAVRSNVSESIPLGGMAAVCFLAATVTRCTMAVRTDTYRLEGPLALGGDLPIACEVAMLPRLAWLSMKALRQTPVAATTWVGITAWFASFHYLNLAEKMEQIPNADHFWTRANALEFSAAVAFACNTITAACGSNTTKESLAAGFMHLVMPVQAALGAYFFLHFEPIPQNVGSGKPYCLLVWSNLLQLGLYLVSCAFFIGSRFVVEDSASEDGLVVATVEPSAHVELPNSEIVDATAEERLSAISMVQQTLMS